MNSIEKYPDIRIYKEKEKCFIKISSVFVEITESEFEKLYSKFLEKYQILFDKNKKPAYEGGQTMLKRTKTVLEANADSASAWLDSALGAASNGRNPGQTQGHSACAKRSECFWF